MQFDKENWGSMFPWLWFWMPSVHFPLGGNVTQDIFPDTDWFFDSIPVEAGIGSLEKATFQKASYGRQLGRMMEVLLPMAKAKAEENKNTKFQEAVERLEEVYKKINETKESMRKQKREALISELESLKKEDGESFDALVKWFVDNMRPKDSEPVGGGVSK